MMAVVVAVVLSDADGYRYGDNDHAQERQNCASLQEQISAASA